MQDPPDFDAPIPMGIRATTRGTPFTVVPGALLAPRRCVVVCISEDVAPCQRQWLQQLGGDQIVGVTGAGKLRGPGEPDAPDHDRQMPLPAVPPAVIPRLTPRGFRGNRGLRDCPGQPMLLVPATAVGAQGRTVDGGRVALGGPGLQQRDQMAPAAADPRRQACGQFLKASGPGTAWRKTPVLRQPGTHVLRHWGGLLQQTEPGIGRRESPNAHDDQRLDKERVGIGLLPPTLAFGGGRWRWNLHDKPEYADKDTARGEPFSASEVGGLVTAILPRQPRSGQSLSAALHRFQVISIYDHV